MIKDFKSFLNENEKENSLDEHQRYILMKFVKGTWNVNNEGLIDIEGSFDSGYREGTGQPEFSKLYYYLEENNLLDKPFAGLKFGKVTGNFNIQGCNLTTLEGIVKSVKSLDCSINQLTSLEGAPQIEYSLDCYKNKLTTLKGAPRILSYFACSNNELESLEYSPEIVTRTYNCGRNKLKTLKGGPKSVGNFYCEDNNLESLEGGPSIIDERNIPNSGGDYKCQHNNLKTLKGAPEYCKYFDCSNNPNLDSLEGAPQDMNYWSTSKKFHDTNRTTFNCSDCNLSSLDGGPSSVFFLYCKNNNLLSIDIYAIEIGASGNILSANTLVLINRTMKRLDKTWLEAVDLLYEEIPDDDWNKIPTELSSKLKSRGKKVGKKFGI